jgi:hypothetical protein
MQKYIFIGNIRKYSFWVYCNGTNDRLLAMISFELQIGIFVNIIGIASY